jgi:hypothetical protein
MSLLISYVDPQPKSKALAVGADGTPYTLTLKNGSSQAWTFYVYQKLPSLSPDIFSLAWFASPFVITPNNRITFNWQIIYNFVWGATGTVRPGVTFNAGGEIDGDPAGANTTNFSTSPGPNLSDAVQAPPSGSLVIKDAANVPNQTFSVGIGMSGTGTYVVQAGANLTHLFTPTPSYWVAAGTGIQVGTVLDIKTVTQTAEAKFPVNQFNRIGTLGQDNTWSFTNG